MNIRTLHDKKHDPESLGPGLVRIRQIAVMNSPALAGTTLALPLAFETALCFHSTSIYFASARLQLIH